MVRAFRCQVRLAMVDPQHAGLSILQWCVPSDVRCVYCRSNRPDPRWQPFCSERCNLLDLHAWLGGQYRIPDEPVPQAEDDSGRGDGGSDE